MNDLKKLKPDWVMDLFRMDFYRIIHGKAFYILNGTMIFILVIMITQMSSTLPLASFLGGSSDSFMSAGMDITMTTVLTGILLSVYIGKEFQNGIVKNIITMHSNKLEYILSKTLTAIVCDTVFVIVFMATLIILSIALSIPLGIASIPGLIVYLFGRILLCIPMSLLIISMNLILRTNYGWSMILSYVFGAGSLITLGKTIMRLIGLEGFSKIFDFTIGGASAALSQTPTLFGCITTVLVTIVWSFVWMLIGDSIMNKRDIL